MRWTVTVMKDKGTRVGEEAESVVADNAKEGSIALPAGFSRLSTGCLLYSEVLNTDY